MILAFGFPFALQSYQIWIIVIGALVCASCGLLGCFLILKRLSLMGDAISHSVLPGIVIAVMITGKINSPGVIAGAAIMGILTPILTDLLKNSGLIHEDACIGAVFTTLFALGVVLVCQGANLDLDPDCILYGEIATTPLDSWVWHGSTPIDLGPRAFWILLTVFLLDVAFVFLFYKELKITTFDKALAESMGMRPKLMHYLLMAMVAITTIACFESVGAVLVVAMFIVPGAAAYLLTDRLAVMLILSVFLGILCSVFGYSVALLLGGEISISGTMAVAAGAIFATAFLFSPRYGLMGRVLRYYRREKSSLADHILLDLYRAEEKNLGVLSEKEFLARYGYKIKKVAKILKNLTLSSMIFRDEEQIRLQEQGREKAKILIRAHRLWELYMHSLGLPPDHVHRGASEMEHWLTPDLCDQIEQTLSYPAADPQGKLIPKIKSTR